VVKQGREEKVEIYYEHILKLTNCLQHQVDESLLTIFFSNKIATIPPNNHGQDEKGNFV